MNLKNNTEKVFTLWDELSDFGTHATDQAITHCMDVIGNWLDAQNSFWVGTVRVMEDADAKGDAMSGWRFGAIHPGPSHRAPPKDRSALQIVHTDEDARWSKGKPKILNTVDPGETNLALVANTGRFRAYSLRGGHLVDLSRFETTAHYDYYYRKMGIVDRIWVLFPINAYAESCFCFDRCGEAQSFSEDDLEWVSFTLRGMKWFHRQLLMSHGLGVSEEPLTASERRLIHQLLTGGSEKSIAAKMEMSPGTIHQYATRIYKKFGARGRAEFTSLWLTGSI